MNGMNVISTFIKISYTKDAFEAKKYAFVSDVARIKALYDYGGIYLDTDVVVYKSFDSILNHKCVVWIRRGTIRCYQFYGLRATLYIYETVFGFI